MELVQPSSNDSAEVNSINGLTGDILLSAGTNISLGTSGNTITINNTASSGLAIGTTPITSGTATRILYDNGGILDEYTITGSGTVVAMQTAPTFITSITDPLVIGGTAVGSSLTLQSTSAVGTTDFIKFLVGSAGGTEAMRIIHNGNVGIGKAAPTATLDILGVKSTTSTNVLNISGGVGIAGSTRGQDITIVSGTGKEYITSSQTVGTGGNYTINSGPGGDLNDTTITGTVTAGAGGSITTTAGSGGNTADTPNSAAVTLKGGTGGGLLYVSGAGGDGSLSDLTNTTGGNSGPVQFTTGFGGSSISKSISIGGNSGAMTFSSNRGGNATANAGATASTGGNSGGYTVSVGAGGAVNKVGAMNAAAVFTGGNSGAISITAGAGGAATGTGAGTAPATTLGGTAGNISITGANGGNAVSGTSSNTGGGGSSISFTSGKGGTGATANGADGNINFLDGYGTTVVTILGNNTGRVGIGQTTPTAVLHLKAGTATASTAPLKFTSGTSLTTAEAGAMEFDGTNLFFTPTGTIRKSIPTVLASRQTAQTAADTNVVTATVGAADASYTVSANVNVTTATLHNFTVILTYTDETNTSRTVTMPFSVLAGTFVTAITNASGAVPYEGIPIHIRAKAGTTIVVSTTGTFTTVTYNVEGMITLLQ